MTTFDKQIQSAINSVTRPHERSVPVDRLVERVRTMMVHSKPSRIEAAIRRLFPVNESETAVYLQGVPERPEFHFVLIDADQFEVPADDDRVWIRVTPGTDPSEFANGLLNQPQVSCRPIRAIVGQPTAVIETERTAFVIPPGVEPSEVGQSLLFTGQISFTTVA